MNNQVNARTHQLFMERHEVAKLLYDEDIHFNKLYQIIEEK